MDRDDSPTTPIDLPTQPVPPGRGSPLGGSPALAPPPPPGAAPSPGAGAAPGAGATPSSPATSPGAGTLQGAGPSPAGQPAWGQTLGAGQPAWNRPAGAPATPARAAATPNQAGLVFGVLLLVVGGLLLVARLGDLDFGDDAWPLWIVVPGLAMLIASFAVPGRGGLGLAVPGAIIATIGIVLWVQDTYDAYVTWAYAWALVAPTAPGVGTLLYGLVRGQGDLVRDGLRMIGTGLALFAGFALFFEGVLGLSGAPIANLDEVLPYLAIGLGVVLVVLSLLAGGRSSSREPRPR